MKFEVIGIEILREGSAARKTLDKIQGEIHESRKAIATIELGPLSPEDMRARLKQAIASHLHRFEPGQEFQAFHRPDETSLISPTVNFAMLAYIFGAEYLVDCLMKRLQADGLRPGLPLADRAAKLRDMRAELDKLERLEELEIQRLQAAGHNILRRADASEGLLFRIWAERDAKVPT